MTDKLRIELKNKLYTYLNKHYYHNEPNMTITHQSYGLECRGVFSLNKEEYKTFMELYINAVTNGVTNLSILEKQKEYAPIIVDIDLEIPLEQYEEGSRLYDLKMVKNLISKFIKSINKYVIKNDYEIYFFEKNNPKIKEDIVKDGFHLMFPKLCIETKIRHLIRNEVVRMCENENLFEYYSNSTEKIIDKSVVSSNGWFLYGSSKPTELGYKLSYVFDTNLMKVYNNKSKKNNSFELHEDELIKTLSVQSSRYSKKNATKLNESLCINSIDTEFKKLGSIIEPKINIPLNKENEINKACKLVSMLSSNRSYNYNDWYNVGLALHSVDSSLLFAWIEFSKKCPTKYKEGECEKYWVNIKDPSDGLILTIRSLAYWAKEDSPAEYEEYMKEEFKSMLNKSLDGNTYYLAKSIYSKYSDKFVCSSIKTNMWWEFKNHRWCRIEDGYTLKNLLSEDFTKEYNIEIADISMQLVKNNSENINREELLMKREKLTKIVEKLMHINFKETLIKECRNLFYDDKFEQKLDSNIFLIGFNNGVFDLKENIFRDGRPDDYITMNTKNDYYKWNEKNPYNKQIFKFFEQVFPNKQVREYFLSVLCSCVSGENKEEKLYIMTGTGSNGKSLTNDLMEKALGDYYMSCDISLITRNRNQSNQASPEKVRMKGRRCGIFQESDNGEKMNVGIVKELTGGDTMLMRDLYKGSVDMIEFKPQMKYFLTANKLPEVPSNDDGTWRRIRVIEFISKFTNNPSGKNEYLIDTSLKQKIEKWSPIFISFLINRYINVYKQTEYLVEPDEVMITTNQYKQENDYITEYILEKLIITNNSKDTIGKDSLWDDFKTWFFNSGYNKKSSPTKPEFQKFINNKLGLPSRKGYQGVIFNIEQENINDSLSMIDNR